MSTQTKEFLFDDFTDEEKVLITCFEIQEVEVVTEVQNFQELVNDFMHEGYNQYDAEIMASKFFAQ